MAVNWMARPALAHIIKGLSDTSTVDYLNAGLMVACCAAAHLFPYHVLLLAYGILGPAHYLTEIAWLHDRSYFIKRRSVAYSFILPSAFIAFAGWTSLSFHLLIAAICVSAAALLTPSLTAIASAGLVGILIAHYAGEIEGVALLTAVLLPSVVHVFVFTALYMIKGARAARQVSGYVALGVFALCAATFFFPSWSSASPAIGAASNFQPVVDALAKIVPVRSVVEIFGFLGFAYAYHYCNWFSKIEIIKWHSFPKGRLVLMVGLYSVVMTAYLVSFLDGFYASLFLSVLHVLLELPLNVKVLFAMPRAAGAR